jgi:hypothetical protein
MSTLMMATNTGNDESCNPIFDDTMSLLSDEVESLISLNKDHTLQQPQTENIITSNSGVVYRLPANPVQFTSSKYEKQYVLLYFIESLFFFFINLIMTLIDITNMQSKTILDRVPYQH